MGNASEFNSIIEVGASLTVTGEVQIYKGLHQIINISSVMVCDDSFTPEAVILSDVNQDTLADYGNDLVSVQGLQIKSISNPDINRDFSFTCTQNGVEVNIFISRHVDKSYRTTLFNELSNLFLEISRAERRLLFALILQENRYSEHNNHNHN